MDARYSAQRQNGSAGQREGDGPGTRTRHARRLITAHAPRADRMGNAASKLLCVLTAPAWADLHDAHDTRVPLPARPPAPAAARSASKPSGDDAELLVPAPATHACPDAAARAPAAVAPRPEPPAPVIMRRARCSMLRKPRREERTICTATAPPVPSSPRERTRNQMRLGVAPSGPPGPRVAAPR